VADVDDEGVADLLGPRQPGVGAHDEVRAGLLDAQRVVVLVERLPPEVVEGQRRAVHQVHVDAVLGEAALGRKGGHPLGVVATGVREREVVHELRELVVAGVGVAAAAVGVAPADGHVVVAGDDRDVVVEQQRPDGVGLRAIAAEVTEAVELLGPSSVRVRHEGAQRVGVGVDTPADSDPGQQRAPVQGQGRVTQNGTASPTRVDTAQVSSRVTTCLSRV
jgi:hypothetical protein